MILHTILIVSLLVYQIQRGGDFLKRWCHDTTLAERIFFIIQGIMDGDQEARKTDRKTSGLQQKRPKAVGNRCGLIGMTLAQQSSRPGFEPRWCHIEKIQ